MVDAFVFCRAAITVCPSPLPPTVALPTACIPLLMKSLPLLVSLLCIVPGASAQVLNKVYSLLITNATIVDIEHNRLIANQTLVISGDTILAIGDTGKLSTYKARRNVNARGKYIIPGLWDMHVHFRGGDTLINENKALFPLFLAHGITTVRDCGGDITPAILTWRRQLEAGLLASPRILTSGPKLDGFKSTWPGSLEVETPAQIRKALDSLQKLKVDFVKIYDSTISRDAYLEIIRQAETRGMKTTGHMPYTVKLTEAIEQGLDASEHLYYVFKACSAKEDSITGLIQKSQQTAKPIGLFAALPLLYNTFDNVVAENLFSQLARKKVAVIPTLFVARTIAELKQMQHTRDSLLSYINPKIQATYQSRVNSAKRQSDEATQFLKKFNTKCNSMIAPMYRAGVQLIAGSDCGAFNSFVYPGSSLHEELKLLVAAGLTPAQALGTATINGAKFMGLDQFYGTIQAGKSSDLVILDRNPLADISAIGRINAIHSKSKFYTKKDLEDLLLTIRR